MNLSEDLFGLRLFVLIFGGGELNEVFLVEGVDGWWDFLESLFLFLFVFIWGKWDNIWEKWDDIW